MTVLNNPRDIFSIGQIIYLLNVATNELDTYPISDTHTMLDLQKRIEQETKISIGEQDIVMANGMTPDPERSASQCWMEPVSTRILDMFVWHMLFITADRQS